jgi:hypothetical protein
MERGMPTCACGWSFRARCLWDRSLYDPAALDEVVALSSRPYAGSQSKSGAGQPQCGACHKFVSNPGRECPHCGYLDGAGYVFGGNEPIPF